MVNWLSNLYADPILIGLTAVIVLGVGAQLLAARLHLPSILILLLVGFVAGPVTGFLDPDALFGDTLFPLVSLSVAIILYEGGLTLRLADLPQIGDVMTRLITVGALVTWFVAAIAARFVVGLGWPMAVLLGAILIVTGPTVIGPLLRQVRPSGDVATVLRWEGILIDPVGAVLAVLIFEAIIAGEFGQAPGLLAVGVLKTLAVGLGLGGAGAIVLIALMRRYWIPDHLQNAFSLLIVLATFTISNTLVHESGLLTVTVLGVILANQSRVAVKHIVEFKENLQVLLIGSLFILLAARVDAANLTDLGWRAAAFVAVLVVIGRPLAVVLSTAGSGLTWRERVFLMCMAPRGIVAAAVASIFAFELALPDTPTFPGSESLVPLTFLVIVATVALYGLLAAPVARALGLAEANPQGALIIGASDVGQAIASVLGELGFTTLLVDSNRRNVIAATLNGFNAEQGNAAAENLGEELNLAGLGRLLAMTPNDEANALAALHFADEFGSVSVFQLPPHRTAGKSTGRSHPEPLRGRTLFHEQLTHSQLVRALREGAEIKATPITDVFDREAFHEQYGRSAVPLFLVTEDERLIVYTPQERPVPRPGQTLVSLVHGPLEERLGIQTPPTTPLSTGAST